MIKDAQKYITENLPEEDWIKIMELCFRGMKKKIPGRAVDEINVWMYYKKTDTQASDWLGYLFFLSFML